MDRGNFLKGFSLNILASGLITAEMELPKRIWAMNLDISPRYNLFVVHKKEVHFNLTEKEVRNFARTRPDDIAWGFSRIFDPQWAYVTQYTNEGQPRTYLERIGLGKWNSLIKNNTTGEWYLERTAETYPFGKPSKWESLKIT